MLRLLASALFWRILLSSLLVVSVLGIGLFRSTKAHEELELQFERLVNHDLKLADDAEVLLRVLAVEVYNRAFVSYQMGRAASLTTLMFLFLGVMVFALLTLQREDSGRTA